MNLMQKLKCYFDFASQIKSIWLTGYLLITWECDNEGSVIEKISDVWRTIEFACYPSGEYE